MQAPDALPPTWTAVHMAAMQGDALALSNLLRHPHESHAVTAKTSKGDQALHLAALSGRAACVALLCEAGADATCRNEAGWTPLMLACLNADIPLVQRLGVLTSLLKHGASIADPPAAGGWTPSLVAARRGDYPVLAALLQVSGAGAWVNESRTEDGRDTALHLAAHAGGDLAVRLLLAAGANPLARNAQGLDAAELAISAATTDGGDFGDGATARFERVLFHLHTYGVAVGGNGGDGGSEWASQHNRLLHRLAAAPRSVPLRRLLSLAALLRRCGCSDMSVVLPDGGRAERPSAVATRHGRPSLAAIFRAAQPAARCLVCLRRPVESAAPPTILLHEGGAANARPSLSCESVRLRRDALRTFRPPEEAHRPSGMSLVEARSASTEHAVSELGETLAEEAANSAIGGGRERWRAFRWIGEIAYTDDADGETPFKGESKASLRDLRERAYGLARSKEDLATAIMACERAVSLGGGDAIAAIAAAAAAAAASDAAPAPGAAQQTYTQRRRWNEALVGGDGDFGNESQVRSVDIVEIEPQRGAPVLHDAHVQLLTELLGPNAFEEIDDAPQARPWSVYAEDPIYTAGVGETGVVTVEVFSLDTPLLLSFVAEARAQAALAATEQDPDEAEGGEEDDEDDDDDGQEEGGDGVAGSRVDVSTLERMSCG